MENLKVKLYNAILTIFDENQMEYKELDDPEFVWKICVAIGMTEQEYKELMFDKDLTEEGYDFEEFCPHCDYVNKVRVSETKEQKNGKKVLVCQDCGKTILACSLCDCVECGKCFVAEE